MPVTSHFRTDAEALLPCGKWLPVVVDLREDSGELVIESAANVTAVETDCGSSLHQPTTSDQNNGNEEAINSPNESGVSDGMLPTVSSIRRVEVQKGDEGLGISIKGGSDHHMPVTISKIFRGMAADRTRQLFVGDTIISVNNVDLQTACHEDAVRALRSAGHKVTIEVQFSSPLVPDGNKERMEKAILVGTESIPWISEIGWGPLTTLSPVKQLADIPDKSPTSPDELVQQQQQTKKNAVWRRVCSLRLAGVFLVGTDSISSRSSVGRKPPDDTGCSLNRIVRIHSLDMSRSINLRFVSPPIAGCWLTWLGSTIDRLADRFRDRANAFLSNPSSSIPMQSQMPFSFPGQFWQVGWLDSMAASAAPSPFDQSEMMPQSHRCKWVRVFVVITDKDFLLFDRAPSLPTLTSHQRDYTDSVFKAALSTWLAKHEINRIPLVFSRLVSLPQNIGSETSATGMTGILEQMVSKVDADSRHLLFGLRIARLPCRYPLARDMSALPIEWRLFRCDSPPSLAIWGRAIITGCHRAVGLIACLRFAVLFNGRLCALELSEDKLALFDLEEEGEPSYWSKPLSALASSSDDGNRLLFFDIRGIGTIDMEMASEADIVACKGDTHEYDSSFMSVVTSPKPIVFAIHSFLSAKLASLGISA